MRTEEQFLCCSDHSEIISELPDADAVENEGETAADEAAIAEQTAEGGVPNEQADDTAGEGAGEDKAEG